MEGGNAKERPCSGLLPEEEEAGRGQGRLRGKRMGHKGGENAGGRQDGRGMGEGTCKEVGKVVLKRGLCANVCWCRIVRG